MRSRVRLFGLFALGVTIFLIVLWLVKPLPMRSTLRASWMYVTGRAQFSAAEAVEALRQRSRITDTARRFSAGYKPVATDGPMELARTSMGDFWVESGEDMQEFFGTIGEQNENIYGSVPNGAIVLDCGANYGIYTRKALGQGATTVVAVEPNPSLVSCLRRTFAAEIAAGKVIIYPKGVWDHDDVLTMRTSSSRRQAGSLTGVTRDAHGTVGVPLTTIDALVAELKLPRVDFIKMDIEGAERKALAGAAKTIAAYRPRMALCLYHLPDDPPVIRSLALSMAPYKVQTSFKEWYGRITPDVAHFN